MLSVGQSKPSPGDPIGGSAEFDQKYSLWQVVVIYLHTEGETECVPAAKKDRMKLVWTMSNCTDAAFHLIEVN